MCSPSNNRGRTSRPSHRSSRLGTTLRTFGRNRIGRVPEAPRRTSSREPSTAFPRMLRMNGFQSGNDSKSVSTCHTRSTGPSISVSVRNSSIALSEQTRRLQLFRDFLDRLLDVLGLAGSRAYEFPAPEQEHDDLAAAEEEGRGLRLLQAVDQSGELLRLILRAAEGEGDGLEVQFLA